MTTPLWCLSITAWGRPLSRCPRLARTGELAVKEMGRIVAGPRHIVGAAFLGGNCSLVDPGRLVERTQRSPGEQRASARVMVVDDSRGARARGSWSPCFQRIPRPAWRAVWPEALELLDEVAVDALVVDFSMPQADGVALVDEVRRRGNLIPIIMLSRRGQSRRPGASPGTAGADAFFDKADFREGTLADALWKMLDD